MFNRGDELKPLDSLPHGGTYRPVGTPEAKETDGTAALAALRRTPTGDAASPAGLCSGRGAVVLAVPGWTLTH